MLARTRGGSPRVSGVAIGVWKTAALLVIVVQAWKLTFPIHSRLNARRFSFYDVLLSQWEKRPILRIICVRGISKATTWGPPTATIPYMHLPPPRPICQPCRCPVLRPEAGTLPSWWGGQQPVPIPGVWTKQLPGRQGPLFILQCVRAVICSPLYKKSTFAPVPPHAGHSPAIPSGYDPKWRMLTSHQWERARYLYKAYSPPQEMSGNFRRSKNRTFGRDHHNSANRWHRLRKPSSLCSRQWSSCLVVTTRFKEQTAGSGQKLTTAFPDPRNAKTARCRGRRSWPGSQPIENEQFFTRNCKKNVHWQRFPESRATIWQFWASTNPDDAFCPVTDVGKGAGVASYI